MENTILSNNALEPTLECVTLEETYLHNCSPGECSPVSGCDPDY